MRAESNTTMLVHKCYGDRTLQMRIKLIALVTKPVHHDYAACLRHMQTTDGQRRWVTDRAACAWYRSEINDLLTSCHASELAEELRMTACCYPAVSEDCTEAWFQEETVLAKQAFNYTLALAKEETWNQVMFAFTLPHCLVALAHDDPAERRRVRRYLRDLCNAVVAAEDLVKAHPKKHALLASFLNLAAFTKQQFAREIMCEGMQCDWDPENSEIVETIAAMITGSTSTADCMEKTFAYMTDGARQTRNKKLSAWSRWWLASVSPYTGQGGMQQIRTEELHYYQSQAKFPDLQTDVVRMLSMSRSPL